MNLKKIIFVGLLALGAQTIDAQYCVTGCNDNTYVKSSDPNTIEYDNMISVFHSSIVKEKDGSFKVWGQGIAADGASDLTSPTVISSGNGFTYSGTPLKAAGGSNVAGTTIQQQFVLLTTDGLYAWGTTNVLINASIKNNRAFGKVTVNGKADGLPTGVRPGDVKMMFGSHGTLAVVTCSGDAWVLSFVGSKNGDGSSQGGNDDRIWHRVRTSDTGNPFLTGVVAMRGTSNALFALTSNGELYTWGTGTYNNNSAAAPRTYATKIGKPTGVTPKMIGMTQSSFGQTYYLLATNGDLYAMGDNSNRQLGDGTTASKNTWQRVTATSDANALGGNIAWISPNEHSDYGNTAAINVLTTNNKQWAWGSNSGNMLGEAGEGYMDPIYMPGTSAASNGLKATDEIIAVETGGHTTVNVKKCSQHYGYVGHKTNGSMGDGSADTGNPSTYSYATAVLIVCGTDPGPKVKNLKVCTGKTANLNSAVQEADPSKIQWRATNDPAAPVIADITAVTPGTYYAFFNDPTLCTLVGSAVVVSEFQPGDPEYGTCVTPLACDTRMYLTQGTDTALYNVDTSNLHDLVFRREGAPAGIQYNGTGFNPRDGFLYAIKYNTNQLIRIYPNGTFTNLGGITDLPVENGAANYNSGEIDDLGFYYVKNQPSGNILYKIDIQQKKVVQIITLNQNTIILDMAYNVRDKLLYSVDAASGRLLSINPANGTVNFIGAANTIKDFGGMIGADGEIYGFSNAGGFYKFDITTGARTKVSDSPASSANDAAHCVTSPLEEFVCFRDPVMTGAAKDTKVGITLLKRAGNSDTDNWPMLRKGGHLALESNSRGFVLTRMTTAQLDKIKTDGNAVEGMMSYDTDAKCLKVYNGTDWKCFNKPSCP